MRKTIYAFLFINFSTRASEWLLSKAVWFWDYEGEEIQVKAVKYSLKLAFKNIELFKIAEHGEIGKTILKKPNQRNL